LDLMVQRDGYLIVPSYSEVMLMDPANALNQHVLPSGHIRNRNRAVTACNENVITNYGAVRNSPRRYRRNEQRRSSIRRYFVDRIPLRSRSMSLMLSKITGRSDPQAVATPSSALPRTVSGPPRSASIGGLSAAWRSSGYNSISEEAMDDCHPLIEPMRPIDEPPPPYEVALKMCAPLYERLRRSANSLTSKLNSLSQSSSKELSYKRQGRVEGQGSSKDGGEY
uniref:CARMIL_C domain-containing protein n=1 Tax=Gongylonema pulchrum TaxID=637853 RepID=A0A183CZX5_9BILA